MYKDMQYRANHALHGDGIPAIRLKRRMQKFYRNTPRIHDGDELHVVRSGARNNGEEYEDEIPFTTEEYVELLELLTYVDADTTIHTAFRNLARKLLVKLDV